MLNNFKNKKILILGFAREGIETLSFLRKLFPKKEIGVGDRKDFKYLDLETKKIVKNDKNLKTYFGKDYLKILKNYDVIVKSPGIPIHLPEIEKAFKNGKITSQTELFFDNCPGKIVGITGTKGKSTVASLIYEILKEGGLKVHLVGNIGKPALRSLSKATKKDVFVFELSSHQLYGLRKSPEVAVFLNLYPEHLDYYKDFKEYSKAKENITLHQKKKDCLVFNFEDKNVKKIAEKSKAKKIPLNITKVSKILDKKEVPLKGNFNLFNIVAAIEVGKIFNVPQEKIRKAVLSFKPLSHRLESVGTFRGITFYNDALSTIPETAIAAIRALGNKVETIILGGFDRNLDFKNLAKEVLKSKIKNVILFPTTGEKIWKEISKQSKRKNLKHFFADNMRDAVRWAYKNTKRGRICLLSCASTSFSLFKDYQEKGNLFKKYIKAFSKK